MPRLGAVGLWPLSEHPQANRVSSLGMNIVGGIIPPERLDLIMALRFVLTAGQHPENGDARCFLLTD